MILTYLTIVFLLAAAVKGQSTTSVTVDGVSSVSDPNNPTSTQTTTTTTNSPNPDTNQTTNTMSDNTTVGSTLTPLTHPSSNTTSTSTNTTTITVPTPTTSVSVSDNTTVNSTLAPSTHPTSNTTSESTNTTITVPTPTTSVSVSDNTTVNSTLIPSTHTNSNTTSESTNTTITVPSATTSVSVSDNTTVNSTLIPSTYTNSNTTSPSTNTTIAVSFPTTSVSESDKTTVNSTLIPSTLPTSNTTSASNTTITVLTPTTSVTGCPSIPCPPQRGCVGGVCLCISGTFLKDDVCEAAQVFPGKLCLLSAFVPEMADRSSEIFQEIARNISDALFKALNGTQGYVRSDVVKLEEGSVVATVNNIYQNTNITDLDIQREIEIAAKSDEFLRGATFNITDLCEVEPFPCDKTTTTCSSTNGVASCSCKEGCDPFLDSNSTYMASQLVVVVVSCVLGGILLIIVVTSVIYCLRKGPLKNSKRKRNYGINPCTSGNGNQPSSTDVKSFTYTTTKWDNDPASENDRMPGGGHLQNPRTNEWRESYDINLDEMTSFKGKNPSCNSSVVQGHVNPDYLPGDEKSN